MSSCNTDMNKSCIHMDTFDTNDWVTIDNDEHLRKLLCEQWECTNCCEINTQKSSIVADKCDNVYIAIEHTEREKIVDFKEEFAPKNWLPEKNGGNGEIKFLPPGDEDCAKKLKIVGSDSKCYSNPEEIDTETCVTIDIPCQGCLEFDWHYSTCDSAEKDPFGYKLNGEFIKLTNDRNCEQSGKEIINIPYECPPEDSEFCFVIRTVDNKYGPSTVIIKNFKFIPKCSEISIKKMDNCKSFVWEAKVKASHQILSPKLALVPCGDSLYVSGYVKREGEGSLTGYPTFCNSDGSKGLDKFKDGCLENGSVFVAKIDCSGNWLWQAWVNGCGFEHSPSLASDCTGNGFVAFEYCPNNSAKTNGFTDSFVPELWELDDATFNDPDNTELTVNYDGEACILVPCKGVITVAWTNTDNPNTDLKYSINGEDFELPDGETDIAVNGGDKLCFLPYSVNGTVITSFCFQPDVHELTYFNKDCTTKSQSLQTIYCDFTGPFVPPEWTITDGDDDTKFVKPCNEDKYILEIGDEITDTVCVTIPCDGFIEFNASDPVKYTINGTLFGPVSGDVGPIFVEANDEFCFVSNGNTSIISNFNFIIDSKKYIVYAKINCDGEWQFCERVSTNQLLVQPELAANCCAEGIYLSFIVKHEDREKPNCVKFVNLDPMLISTESLLVAKVDTLTSKITWVTRVKGTKVDNDGICMSSLCNPNLAVDCSGCVYVGGIAVLLPDPDNKLTFIDSDETETDGKEADNRNQAFVAKLKDEGESAKWVWQTYIEPDMPCSHLVDISLKTSQCGCLYVVTNGAFDSKVHYYDATDTLALTTKLRNNGWVQIAKLCKDGLWEWDAGIESEYNETKIVSDDFEKCSRLMLKDPSVTSNCCNDVCVGSTKASVQIFGVVEGELDEYNNPTYELRKFATDDTSELVGILSCKITALAFHPFSQELFGIKEVNSDKILVKINFFNAEIKEIVDITGDVGNASITELAFRNFDCQLFALDENGNLYKLNIDGSTELIGSNNLDGLVFLKNLLYSFKNNSQGTIVDQIDGTPKSLKDITGCDEIIALDQDPVNNKLVALVRRGGDFELIYYDHTTVTLDTESIFSTTDIIFAFAIHCGSSSLIHGFTGLYDVLNWRCCITVDGQVEVDNVPVDDPTCDNIQFTDNTCVDIWGSYKQDEFKCVPVDVKLCIPFECPCESYISFHWEYTTTDCNPKYDPFLIKVTDGEDICLLEQKLTEDYDDCCSKLVTQSGDFKVMLPQKSRKFCFIVRSLDNMRGAAHVKVSDFRFSPCIDLNFYDRDDTLAIKQIKDVLKQVFVGQLTDDTVSAKAIGVIANEEYCISTDDEFYTNEEPCLVFSGKALLDLEENEKLERGRSYYLECEGGKTIGVKLTTNKQSKSKCYNRCVGVAYDNCTLLVDPEDECPKCIDCLVAKDLCSKCIVSKKGCIETLSATDITADNVRSSTVCIEDKLFTNKIGSKPDNEEEIVTVCDNLFALKHVVFDKDGPYPVNPDGPVDEHGAKLHWNPYKGSLRSGCINDDGWNPENIGDYSTALGLDIVATGEASLASGYAPCCSDGEIISSGIGAQAFGYAIGSDSLIEASNEGAQAGGRVDTGGQILASGRGANAFGFASDGGLIEASGDGSTANCFAVDLGQIKASAEGSHTMGYAEGSDSIIHASGKGTLAGGKVTSGGKVEASGDASIAYGFADGTNASISTGDGAYGSKASGYALGADASISTGQFAHGSKASGRANGTNASISTGNSAYGSKAGGRADGINASISTGKSAHGSNASGWVDGVNASILTGQFAHGSKASGYAQGTDASISTGQSARGSKAGGRADGINASISTGVHAYGSKASGYTDGVNASISSGDHAYGSKANGFAQGTDASISTGQFAHGSKASGRANGTDASISTGQTAHGSKASGFALGQNASISTGDLAHGSKASGWADGVNASILTGQSAHGSKASGRVRGTDAIISTGLSAHGSKASGRVDGTDASISTGQSANGSKASGYADGTNASISTGIQAHGSKASGYADGTDASISTGIQAYGSKASGYADGTNASISTGNTAYGSKASGYAEEECKIQALGQGALAMGCSNASDCPLIAEGHGSSAIGINSHAVGLASHARGIESKARLRAQWALSSGKFEECGDAQCCKYVLRTQTVGSTNAEFFLDHPANTERLDIPLNTTICFKGKVVARNKGSVNCFKDACWKFKGIIKNDDGNIGLYPVTVIADDSNPLGWDLYFSTVNDSLSITAKVPDDETDDVCWVACIKTAEVGVVRSISEQNKGFKWTERAGGTEDDDGNSITIDKNGNVYITGGFAGTATFGTETFVSYGNSADIFVSKLDNNGNWLWTKQAGSDSSARGSGIAVDSNGNVYITGYFFETATFGTDTLTGYGNGQDIFVSKLDTNGNWLWTRQAGSNGSNEGYGIAVDGNGNVYITGYFTGSTATFGTEILTSFGSTDIFVSKLDTTGNWLWTNQAGGTGSDRGNGIAVDGNGNVYVTGHFFGTATFGGDTLNSTGQNVFVSKLDNNGNWIWSQQSLGSSNKGKSIDIDGNRNVYVTGNFSNTATFGTHTFTSYGQIDIFISKLDPDGTWVWVNQVGSVDQLGRDRGYGIAVDNNCNVYATGFFRTTATFGTDTIMNAGARDIFVTKLVL